MSIRFTRSEVPLSSASTSASHTDLVCERDDCIIYGISLWIWHPNRKKSQQTFHFMRPKRNDGASLARSLAGVFAAVDVAVDWRRSSEHARESWNSKLNVISPNASFGVVIIIRKSFLGIENNTHTPVVRNNPKTVRFSIGPSRRFRAQ